MAAAMAMLVGAVKTKETFSETVSGSGLSTVSKINSFGSYESARSDMGSMIDDQSLGSDQWLLGFSPTSLRPIIERRRSDPQLRGSRSECLLDKSSSSESANIDPIIAYHQQSDNDLAQKLATALASPAVAAVMRHHVATGITEFVEKRIEPLEEKMNKLVSTEHENQIKISETSREIESLRERVKKLEGKLQSNQSAQMPTKIQRNYVLPAGTMKMNNVVVSGITEEKDNQNKDNVEDKIKALFHKLEVTVSCFQASRLGKEPSTTPRPILVELANPWDKRKVYTSRLKLRQNDLNNIFINEDLDRNQAEIYYNTRRAKKANIIAKTWTNGGIVHILKFGETQPYPVESLEELTALLPNFEITKRRNSPTRK